MSDDIPPLISETPPPMSKSDWEDDDDIMDFPHLEMPSDNSLSPDGIPSGWNPIESLPYDSNFIDKSVGYIESNTNESSLNWSLGVAKKDKSLESSLCQHETSSHHNNLSIWKDKENIIPCKNIKQLTSNHNCDSIDHQTEVKHNTASENDVINSSTKIDEKSSVISEQNITNIENVTNNIRSQCSQKVELPNNSSIVEDNENSDCELNINSEKSSVKETLVNGTVECIDIKEFSNQINCVPNVLLENMKNNISDFVIDGEYNMLNNVSVNGNNNTFVIKNDQLENSDYCDFETVLPDSLNVSLPNRTSKEHTDIFENHELVDKYHNPEQIKIVQFNDNSKTSQNTSILVEKRVEQNNEHHVDDLDSEGDDFCDFHAFTNYTEPSKSEIPTTKDFEHSNNKQDKCDNDDNNLMLKSNNQNISCKISNNDDDNFCDFESQVSNDKQCYDTVLDSNSRVQIDYKQFCKDAFQGDYTQNDETNLQDLEHELSQSLVWQHLKDIESSPALNYNWSKSESNNVFLSSLSIDSRNILYGAFWNPKFPRFAANMSDHPLEPLKSTNNDIADSKILHSFSSGSLQANVTVPDVQFDWKSSGLINPLDFQPQTWKISELVKEEGEVSGKEEVGIPMKEEVGIPMIEEAILVKEEAILVKEKEEFVKDEKILVNEEVSIQSSPESIDIFNDIFGVSKNQFAGPTESSPTDVVKISLEAQMILDNLPDFEVLQKSYLFILEKENNNPFLS